MQRLWLKLALVALVLGLAAACSGEYYYDSYYSDCPRYYTYGPMNCSVCHW